VEAAFLRGLSVLEVETPTIEDLERMAELVERYAAFPLGGTDASVIATAERLGTVLLITLDERPLRAIVPRHCSSFRILPSDA